MCVCVYVYTHTKLYHSSITLLPPYTLVRDEGQATTKKQSYLVWTPDLLKTQYANLPRDSPQSESERCRFSEDCTYPPQCSDVVKCDALKLLHSANYSAHLGFTSMAHANVFSPKEGRHISQPGHNQVTTRSHPGHIQVTSRSYK